MSYTLSSIPLLSLLFFFHVAAYHRALHSFPTRRSSDLVGGGHRGVGNYRDFCVRCSALNAADVVAHALEVVLAEDGIRAGTSDRIVSDEARGVVSAELDEHAVSVGVERVAV